MLNHPKLQLWNPRFSPDDRWISFNATTPENSQIFVAPVRGGSQLIPESEWIRITDGNGDGQPWWSPDGNTLYFLSVRDRYCCIWAQRLDSGKRPIGQPIGIFHAHEARRSLLNIGKGDLGISVAVDKIVLNLNERSGNIWMMTLSPE